MGQEQVCCVGYPMCRLLSQSHPCLRWCVGPGCDVVFMVERPQMKRVTCTECRSSCW